MKTSNVLLLGLLSFLFIAMIGVNYSIKKEFEKRDFNDRFNGYTRHPLKPFKHIKLTGQPFGSIQIQPGETFEIRKEKIDQLGQSMILGWQQDGDTLIVNQQMEAGTRVIPYIPDGFAFRRPHLYIFAPTLSSLHSHGIASVISHWPSGNLYIQQIGKGVLLSDNHFDEVFINAAQNSYVGIDGKNSLNSTKVILRDSSKLAIEKDVFGKFILRADNTTTLNLPGSLLKRNLSL